MKTYQKITINFLALSLVIVSLFTHIDIKPIIKDNPTNAETITLQIPIELSTNNSMIIETQALSLREIIAGAITLASIWICNGIAVFHIGELTQLGIEEYQAWIDSYKLQNPTKAAQWEDMIDYVEDTKQDVSDGEIVLPKEYVRSLTDMANIYLQSDLKYRTYKFTWNGQDRYQKTPMVQDIDVVGVSAEPYIVRKYDGSKEYWPVKGSDELTFTKTIVAVNSYTIYIKLDIYYKGVLSQTRYSNNIAEGNVRYDHVINNLKYEVFFKAIGTTLTPIFYAIGPDYNDNVNRTVTLNCSTPQTTCSSTTTVSLLTRGLKTQISDIFVPNSGIFATFDYESSSDEIPDIVDGGEDSDYYYVPTPDTGTPPSTPTPPTRPVPPESYPIYEVPTYNPLPTDGTWTDLENPVGTIPMPNVENVLDGTYFKDMWSWFTNWLSYSLNGIMNFWESFVNTLFGGINSIVENVRNLWLFISDGFAMVFSKDFDFSEFYCETLPQNSEGMSAFTLNFFGGACKVFQTTDVVVEPIQGFVEYVFDVITYISTTLITSIGTFVSTIIELLNILPTGIKELFVFITSSLTLLLTVKFVRFILDLIGSLPIL